jgi:hypothetical protein
LFFSSNVEDVKVEPASAHEKELISQFRKLEGCEELQGAAIRQVRALVEAADKITQTEIDLRERGKLPQAPS